MPVPVPGPAEVLVRVEACGICLSDVHLLDGTLPAPLPVVTPGPRGRRHDRGGRQRGPGLDARRPGRHGGRPRLRPLPHLRARALRGVRGLRDHGLQLRRRVGAVRRRARPGPRVRAGRHARSSRRRSWPTPSPRRTPRSPTGPACARRGRRAVGHRRARRARRAGRPAWSAPPRSSPSTRCRRPRARPRASGRRRARPDREDVVERGPRAHRRPRARRRRRPRRRQRRARAGGRPPGPVRPLRHGRALARPVELGPGLFFGLQGQSLLGHLGYKKRHLDELVDLVRHGRLDVSGSISGVMPLEEVAGGVEQLTSKHGDPVRLVVQPWA